ncbi:MAG: hypothetical protein US39_C0008G0045 [Microgenomates group bacterium GW2011_GWC1_37_12b]|uniref:O-antigen ligase-related domain-containing protein n=1 Tax=Candidatus Woesebacteria bacterium GW2011_GWB1_38_8b TaxID=1618571 RepID=A0A0G0NKI6_9BACT|nr:MAG: hypothetical protein US39_C0008G0045 [Microgenomates group bacterium GW2011_GWC1_37_12b]KKQ86424.1 MAG: hypothetical protein UT10_C0025G0015 [Candidatus Woesebacteria bacterium GW2011_GWB1_38_8b]
MIKKIFDNIVVVLFYILFFLTPLVLFPKTSEVFEFNKMVFVYAATIFIVFFWILKMILSRKIIFKRSPLDIPLILFLISNVISTIFSIDQRTSLLGYYSRFNGGLLSTVSYLMLYWAYVSNMDRVKTKTIFYTLLTSSFFVSAYAILQHFGIDKNIWADDVVNRVFSTIGQPNWLAAWTVAIIPITWGLLLKSKIKDKKIDSKINFKHIAIFILSTLLFVTLIFTKSRSGFIGFIISALFFWGFLVVIKIRSNKLNFKTFQIPLLLSAFYLILTIFFGTPWSASIEAKLSKPAPDATKRSVSSVLESGSTGSGQIRKIVWKGALQIWKKYPLIGSGVETFAYTYHQVKPIEHNLTAEWDYLYNKAHNDYLNFLANNGVFGLVSYLIVIVLSLLQISNFKFQISKQVTISQFYKLLNRNYLGQLDIRLIKIYNLALLSGYAGLLVTNFFGFSVVSTSLLFFLIPAMAFSLTQKPQTATSSKKLSFVQIIIILLLLPTTYYLLLTTYKYWHSDILYAKTSTLIDKGQIETAQKTGSKLLNLSANEPLYHDLQSRIYIETALYLAQNQKAEIYNNFIKLAEKEGQEAIKLSPANVLYKRNLTSIYLNLATIDPKYLENAKETLSQAIIQAPTDAKLLYNLGLIYIKTGDYEKAKDILAHTVEIKENYASARYALALVNQSLKNVPEAKSQLKYILEKIDPNNVEAKRLLDELGK